MKSGKVKSCGCIYLESNKGRNATHGMSKSRIFRIWMGIKQRCNINYVTSKYHGQKNIRVCDEWKDFVPFYEWSIANGYSDTLTIDRIDNKLGYRPDNCRWVDFKTQERNRTNNRMVTIKGETHVLSEWAEKNGISRSALAWRLDHGWNDEELFMKPDFANRIIRRKKQWH